MIIISEGLASSGHALAIETMFEDRKRLFVDLLGWSVPVVDGRFEKDRFDDQHATYLIALDTANKHIGSMRLLPTSREHILGNLFPSLCEHGAPRGPHIFEITRLCLPARFRAAERLAIRNRLISAMVDHALGTGIAELTGVVHEGFLRQVLSMGWRAKALGEPKRIGGSLLGAFHIFIDRQTPQLLAANQIYAPVPLALAGGTATAA